MSCENADARLWSSIIKPQPFHRSRVPFFVTTLLSFNHQKRQMRSGTSYLCACRCVHEVPPGQAVPGCPVPVPARTPEPRCTRFARDTKVTPPMFALWICFNTFQAWSIYRLLKYLYFSLCLFHREETADAPPPSTRLLNPFATVEEDRRWVAQTVSCCCCIGEEGR